MIENRQETTQQLNKEPLYTTNQDPEAFQAKYEALVAYNADGLEIASAPFLEDDARIALLGLLSACSAFGIEPDNLYRKNDHARFNKIVRVFEYGWKIKRLESQTAPNGATRNYDLLVTPDLKVKSVYDSDGSKGLILPERAKDLSYRDYFKSEVIIADVSKQATTKRLSWTKFKG